jgi:hypothetical protein
MSSYFDSAHLPRGKSDDSVHVWLQEPGMYEPTGVGKRSMRITGTQNNLDLVQKSIYNNGEGATPIVMENALHYRATIFTAHQLGVFEHTASKTSDNYYIVPVDAFEEWNQ